jgi:hypothetical protein
MRRDRIEGMHSRRFDSISDTQMEHDFFTLNAQQ